MTTLTNQLKFSPPTLVSPKIVHVGGNYNRVDGVATPAARVAGYSGAPSAYSGTSITNPGGDILVVFDSKVGCNLSFGSCRNVVVIGGEIDISNALIRPSGWTSGTMPYGNNHDPNGWLNGPRNLVSVSNVTGEAYFEGLYLHGSYAIDGFKMGHNNIVTIQACRIEAYAWDTLGGGPGWTTPSASGKVDMFHNDLIQNYDGIKELRIDWITGICGFQGIMLRSSANYGTDSTKWGPTYISRCNFDSAERLGLHAADQNRSTNYYGAINFIPFDYASTPVGSPPKPPAPDVPANIKGPIFIDDWFIKYDTDFANFQAAIGPPGGTYGPQYINDPDLAGRKMVWWPTWNIMGDINGDPSNKLFPPTTKYWNATVAGQYIREGLPAPTAAHPENPTGDYVRATDVGMGYVSPGYIGSAPPPPPPPPPPPVITGKAVSNYVQYPYVS